MYKTWDKILEILIVMLKKNQTYTLILLQHIDENIKLKGIKVNRNWEHSEIK